MKIINQGFVTSRLEAELVGDKAEGATLEFHPERLKGLPEELRELRITLTNLGPTDLTIGFKAHNVVPDLRGRDRVHFADAVLCPERSRFNSSEWFGSHEPHRLFG